MSALREWAATMGPEARAAVAVSSWGKWKTTAQVGAGKACMSAAHVVPLPHSRVGPPPCSVCMQMASLTLLLLTRDGASGPWMEAAAAAGPPLLGVAAWLTVHSLALYLRGLWRFMA